MWPSASSRQTMSNTEDMEDCDRAARRAIRERGARRCYHCNGSFGLIRHRLGLKQFCSASCLIRYRAEIEQTTTRIKEWADFLTRKP
jgi:hypothetical protein